MANNSFATFFGASYPAVTDVVDTAPTYGDAINVLDGTFDPGGAAPNYPTEAEVLLGVVYGTTGSEEFTGNYRGPIVSDVRAAIAYGSLDSLTGVLDLPSINDVRLAVVYDNTTKTGNVTLPAEADVRAGTTYDSLLSRSGTLSVAAADYPGVDDVRLGVIFDSGNLTGTVRVPPVNKVELGYVYDANDTLEGTLDPGSGATDYPIEDNVRAGVSYNFGAQIGVYEPALESDVRLGVTYGANGTEYIGAWTGVDPDPDLATRGWIG